MKPTHLNLKISLNSIAKISMASSKVNYHPVVTFHGCLNENVLILIQVLLLIAVTLVVAAYAQQETAQHEDLELAETKGKKHTRHIQPNNKPSPQRFRPRIRSPSGRGRSDSSENGGSEAGGEYDPNNDGKHKSTFKAKILFINTYVLDV